MTINDFNNKDLITICISSIILCLILYYLNKVNNKINYKLKV